MPDAKTEPWAFDEEGHEVTPFAATMRREVLYDVDGRRRGVLDAERARSGWWRDRALPDPVAVTASEATTRQLYGAARGWSHPDRAPLEAFFAQHPEMTPTNWSR